MEIYFRIVVRNARNEYESFSLPEETDKAMRFIDGYDYEITDYTSDLDYNIDFHKMKIEEINFYIEKIKKFDEYKYYGFCAFIKNGSDIDEAIMLANKQNYIIHCGCSDMSDIAYRAVVQEGLFGDISEDMIDYIDYIKLGNSFDMNGNYIQIRNNIIVEIC